MEEIIKEREHVGYVWTTQQGDLQMLQVWCFSGYVTTFGATDQACQNCGYPESVHTSRPTDD